ncbi:MAG: hypothetical protein CVT66_08715 [Actinobacteria bacterium HGW-Actinobacteria-6]|jgi:hypothetical protein|nr:MAG: hypothetical protein CVT66_08715 [Actinobacteria bacterium HGW-Actinobacteria-6]
MRKILMIGIVAALAVGVLGLAGCSKEPAAEEETMGVWGYVASGDDALIEVAESQPGVDVLVVDRVLAPEDSWLVVHLEVDGMPGERVGLIAVPKGESTSVEIPLEGVTTPNVIVALHADRGVAGEFDFDMDAKETTPDRPFFVDSKELAKVIAVRDFGVKADAGTAAIEVSNQPGATTTLKIDRAIAPTGAWIVVHLDDDGMPGKRVGTLQIPAGESLSVEVELDPSIPLTEKLFVAVHADRGIAGEFEFDMEDKVGSPDQPFFVDGAEVATAVVVK